MGSGIIHQVRVSDLSLISSGIDLGRITELPQAFVSSSVT